jgi:hypothetical protein
VIDPGARGREGAGVLELMREVPDTDLAAQFDGEPMVQSFLVGDLGRVWITTAEALSVPGFGLPWVHGQLASYSPEELPALLAGGLRLRAGELVAA